MNTITKRLIALASLAALLASSCGIAGESSEKFEKVSEVIDSGDSSADDSGSAPPTTISVEFDGDDESTPAEAESSAGADRVGQLTAADLGRSIIFTGYVELEVENVAQSGQEAIAAISDLGGFVFGQNTTGGVEPRSEITFR